MPLQVGFPTSAGPVIGKVCPQLFINTGGVGVTIALGQATVRLPGLGGVTVVPTVNDAGSLSQHGFGELQTIEETFDPTEGTVMPGPPVK